MDNIFFKDYGNGFPIILLHGFCETHEIWNELATNLSDEFRVLTPDLPGFGHTPLQFDKMSLAVVAGILNKWLDAMDIAQCIVVGHSLGGYITLSMAEKYPEKLTAFGLFNSSAFADSPEKKVNRDKLIHFVRKEGVAPFIKTFVPSLFYAGRIGEFLPIVERIKQTGSETSPEAVAAYAAAMRDRPDHMAVLSNYRSKVLLIAGEYDQNVPLEVSVAMGARLDPKNVHILPDTAHMAMYEQPEMATAALRDFVTRMLEQPPAP